MVRILNFKTFFFNLLYNIANIFIILIDSEQSPGVYLRDDPLFGTHLQNQSELRVHSAEKAAFYLDAALATRGVRDDTKDSHLLYTLHVYQYSVGGKGAGNIVLKNKIYKLCFPL